MNAGGCWIDRLEQSFSRRPLIDGQDGDARHGTPDDPRIVLIGIEVHAAVFLEVNKPKPVVLFELAKGWLTGEREEPGKIHELREPHRAHSSEVPD